jgi:glutaredoxin
MNHPPKVRLLLLSTCPRCQALRDLLAARGIAYEATDVDLLPAAERAELLREMAPHNPKKAFPVVFIGNKAIIGLQEELILAELEVST